MQKTLFSLLFLLGIAIHGFAQQEPPAAKNVLVTTKGDTLHINSDSVFTKVEVESDFPGGQQAWLQFLQANLEYPKKAVRKEIQGMVVLQFIVCTDGSVCNAEAISGPPELRKAALEALKKTPNWTPASQSGKLVKSYKKQPIIFRLESK